jgi:hypothetical protein
MQEENSWNRPDRRVFALPLAEKIGRSKGLVKIDPLPDTPDEALTYTYCIGSQRQATQYRKDRPMNPQMQTQAERSMNVDIAVNDADLIAGRGFDPHEVASLLWLRQWYQNGGSDRATIVRHLEFLRLLWRRGELEP